MLIAFLTTSISSSQDYVQHIDEGIIKEWIRTIRAIGQTGNTVDFKGQTVYIGFGGLATGKRAAVALGKDKEGVIILINERNWRGQSFNQRLWTLAHELAHDLYNLGHGDIELMEEKVPEVVTSRRLNNALIELYNHINTK